MTQQGPDAVRAQADADRQTAADAAESLSQELAATNILLLGLSRELSAQRVETAVRVEGLRAEADAKRRVRFFGVVALAGGVIYAHDEHIEECSPGARLVDAVDFLVRNPSSRTEMLPEERMAEFERIYNTSPAFCDVSFPLHSHDGDAAPTEHNILGGVFLGLAMVAAYVYHRWRKRVEYGRVMKAVVEEEKVSGRT